ncbi:sensor histidine kinase [Porphyrobacter sp. AAP60]|uniref:sensor histidine kinase n=1 Tax=Porphyrobacter sp. AAP60 TaxID=1523423 RepID=UPI0012E29516|nr:ATP-binding protein [Porphyrobacter sp. AAP60]
MALLARQDLPGLQQVPDSSIVIVDPGRNAQVRRVVASSATFPLHKQARWPAGASAQFHFKLYDHTEAGWPAAIYVPRLGGAARLSLNGVPVTSSETSSGPLLASLNRKALQAEGNRIDILQDGAPGGIGLGGVYLAYGEVGSSSVVHLELRRTRLASLLQIAGWIGLIAGLAGLLLGAHRLASGSGIAIAASVLLPALIPALANFHMGAFKPASLAIVLVLLAGCCFVFSLRKLPGTLGVICIGLGLVGISAPMAIILAGFAGGIAESSLPMALYVAACLALFLAIGMPCLLLADIRQFFRSFRETQNRVKQQETIIMEQETALHLQISEKAVLQERQRFVRDIHDGIGGQLLSLLLRARSGMLEMTDVEYELQRGLADLRLVVDAMDQVGSDLEGALAVFNTRSRQQLETANISFEWNQAEELGPYSLGARQILSLYRIMQEAVSNSVRHSQADRLEVSVHPAHDIRALEITISDNGKGFDMTQNVVGKGLQNMRTRAAQLGAEIKWDTGEHGTIVRLYLPTTPTN